MPDTLFDVVIIGGGPGGYVAAIRAAQLGMKPALVERDKLGGVCLNWGCIPSKSLLKNAQIFNTFKHAGDFGITFDNLGFDFAKVMKRSRTVSNRIVKGVEFLMKKNKITLFEGSAAFEQKGAVTVSVKGKKPSTVGGKKFLLATGASPRKLPGLEIDGDNMIDSSGALGLKKLPPTMVIVGGGAIGVEFAYFWNAFGCKVTILEMMPHLLPVEDEEIATILQKSLIKSGIKVVTGARVLGTEISSDNVIVSYDRGKGTETAVGDKCLVAVGVTGNTAGLGLERIGVDVEKGFIKTGEHYQTSNPDVHAIGDVIGPPLLAHVASHEAIYAIEGIHDPDHPGRIDYDSIPGCTYCQPQVASIGLTEKAARERGHELKIGRYPFRALGKAIAAGETEGMVKLIFDARYGELLGAHIVGSEATEQIAELGMAKALEATYKEILGTVHAHPTLAEAVMEAAGDAYGEAIHL